MDPTTARLALALHRALAATLPVRLLEREGVECRYCFAKAESITDLDHGPDCPVRVLAEIKAAVPQPTPSAGGASWLVMRKIDDGQPEWWGFTSLDDAARFFATASANWTETYLCSVAAGPGLPLVGGPGPSRADGVLRAVWPMLRDLAQAHDAVDAALGSLAHDKGNATLPHGREPADEVARAALARAEQLREAIEAALHGRA